ncbi:acyl-CoA thioesterase [Sanguibacter suaedae]|uniref:Acyl-CoA thioesterase 2 n=1 Tax=Sanguibacter suaedae TaxID=2795737 RepID=A0A934M9U9_9MICO|nr:acyl-CoA thioesterase II [Sanguibacter suaedae]
MPDPEKPVPTTATADHDPLAHLLDVLALSYHGAETGEDVYSGASVHQPNGRVYGGQVLAQALLAAGATVDRGRLPHSLHGYFLRAGDVAQPVDFAVERLRDGRSFSARRTHAYQGGQAILSMIASFQEDQPGLEHSSAMPDVPAPDDVVSAHDALSAIDHPRARWWSRQSAFDVRHVQGSLYLGAGPEATDHQAVWMRSRGTVPDDQLLHRAVLAYACDQIMLEPILRTVGHSWATPGLSVASLDHAMWWHRDVRVDDWLLYVQSSSSAQGGRGLGSARVFAQDGTLVASIAQEGMVRVPEV